MPQKFENKNKTEIIAIMLDPWPFIMDQCRAHGWSSAEISAKANVSASGVRALLNGQNKRPSAETLQGLLRLCINEYTGIHAKGPAPKTSKKKVTKKKVTKKKVTKKKASKKRGRRATLPDFLK